MNKKKWLVATDPEPMLKFLRGKVSDRKLRLFAVACCTHIWHLLHDPVSRETVALVERYADGEATGEEIAPRFSLVGGSRYAENASEAANPEPWEAACSVARNAAHNVADSADMQRAEQAIDEDRSYSGAALDAFTNELIVQSSLLRDIFGNLRPVTLAPRWLTSTVVALAAGIYSERAFDRMPILADALEEAGCDHADILGHCRGDGPHLRGCWVIDLLLGKS